jgi:crotonobetainyl-CoA:carnitine CoA-transferase CaiB-like acyl-CoA transferase
LYACADGRFVAVACAEPRTWGALCDALGVPELKPNLHKPEPAEATANAMAAIFLTRAAMEWVERLAPLGAAVTRMNHAAQLLDDPHVRIIAPDGSQTGTATAAPHKIGEDTEAVLASAGFSSDEIETMVAQGLI